MSDPLFFPTGEDILGMIIRKTDPHFPNEFCGLICEGINFNPTKINQPEITSRRVFMNKNAENEFIFMTQEQKKGLNILPPIDTNLPFGRKKYCIYSSVGNLLYHVLPYLILLGLVYADGEQLNKIIKDDKIIILNKFLALAAYVHVGARKLDAMKNDLSEYGLPFMAWVLEHDDHLFTWHGQETFEASLDKHFLKDMVERMWRLSAGLFGRKPFSYETLAAKLRVDNIEKVKTAVRRISIIARHNHIGEKSDSCPEVHSPIHYTESGWWWNARDNWEDETPPPEKHVSRHHNVMHIREQIDKLIEPYYVNPFEKLNT